MGRSSKYPDVNHIEIATAEWVLWFNTERPHEYLDDFTPEAVEKLHYDHRRTPTKSGVIQHNQSPDSPGRLTLTPCSLQMPAPDPGSGVTSAFCK